VFTTLTATSGYQGAASGPLNGTIGATTANTGVFTSVTTTSAGQITGYHTGAIGANTANTGAFTTLTTTGTATVNSTSGVTAIANGGTTGVGNIGATGATFNTIFAKATTAQYADLAEKYISDCELNPGDVVVFGGTYEITTTTVSHDDRIAGVVSTNPAYLMNSDAEGYAIALTGRVPCRVLGPVSKGQSVVSSDIAGVARALDKTLYTPGCVIGKSLEEISNDEIRTIEVVVGRS
jgi:hypothetical protein